MIYPPRSITIIIPTLNEAENIGNLVQYLRRHADEHIKEILVIDGGSTDQTVELAKRAGAQAFVCPERGRAKQMHYGVRMADGDVYYFVHADSIPPSTYVQDILDAIAEGNPIGCYRFKFTNNHPLLRINSWFTRFEFLWCRGGDQTLYITAKCYEELKGFKMTPIMEEYDLIDRARKLYSFKIIPKNTLVSPRKYENNSYFRVNFANLVVFTMWRLGKPASKLEKTYKRLLNHPKA